MKYLTCKNFKSGFTLTEIIVVVIILGAMAGLAFPKLTSHIEKVRSGEGIQILIALLDAQRMFEFENGNYASTLANLDVTIGDPENFKPLVNADISNSDPLAQVTRIGDDYILTIDADGTIKCDDSAGTAGSCSRIGCSGGVCN